MIGHAEIIVRLLLGALFGGIIGFERHAHGRDAGVRTNLLVCVASVLIMIVSEYYHYLGSWDSSHIRVDPARLAAGAITGVGFLGAGVIVKTGLTVQGLTTAACLWIVSALGLSIGSGLYVSATVGFVITFVTLLLLRKIEDMMPSLTYRFVTVMMHGNGNEEALRAAVGKYGAVMNNIDYERDVERGESIFDITLSFKDMSAQRKIFDELSSLQSVKKVTVRS